MISFSVSARFFLVLGIFVSLTTFHVNAQPADANVEFRKGLEQQAFFLVNEYRKKQKMPVIAWNDAIAQVARGHSKEMASGEVDFGHDGFRDRVKKLTTVLVGLNGAGENVLKTDDPDEVAARAVDLWLHSPHHLKNIRGDYNYSGMGVWRDPQGVIYFTQIFVKLQPPAQAAQAAPPPQVVTPFGFLAAPTPER